MSRIDERKEFLPVRIAVLTVSDTRQIEDDKSGNTLVQRLEAAGHILADRKIIRDERDQIAEQLRAWVAAHTGLTLGLGIGMGEAWNGHEQAGKGGCKGFLKRELHPPSLSSIFLRFK